MVEFSIDKDVLDRVFEQVRDGVQKKGHSFKLNPNSVKKLMERVNCDSTEWTLETPKVELELLVARIVKKLEKAGEKPSPRAPNEHTLSDRNGFGSAVLGRNDVRHIVQEIRNYFWGTESPPFDFRNVAEGKEEQVFKQALDWIHSISTPGSTLLFDGVKIQLPQKNSPIDIFYEAVTRLSTITDGYWDIHSACAYVLCDLYRDGNLSFTFKGPKDFYSASTLTITIRGPITPEGLRDAYAKKLEEWEIKTYNLTKTQVALLHLYAETPGQTWAYRLEIWDRWCESTPGLERFPAPTRRAEKLSNAHSQALKRSNWNITCDQYLGWPTLGDHYLNTRKKARDFK